MEPPSITNENTKPIINQEERAEEEEEDLIVVGEEEIEKLQRCLPKANWFGSSKYQLIKLQDFWYPCSLFPGVLKFQRHFIAQDTDILVTSFPKTGTTWLNSLVFSVIGRCHKPLKESPLLTHNPHELVYCLEGVYAGNNPKLPRPHQLKHMPPPRIFYSHLPYASLPESIKTSKCKILYIARNPLDMLVSHWHFFPNIIRKAIKDESFQPQDINECANDFCQGKVLLGPFFEHVVRYWKMSLEQPDKVLFLKYEDLKKNPRFYVKKLAEFIGVPFSRDEENDDEDDVIQEIIELCSLNLLKKLEVNNSGSPNDVIANNTYFRDGEVGGWRRYVSAPMAEKIKSLMEEKLRDTGLEFNLLPE